MQRVVDEIVFLNLETSMYYAVDPVAARMTEHLLVLPSVGDVVGAMAEEYETDEAVLEHDVQNLLRKLRGAGLIVRPGTIQVDGPEPRPD